MDTTVRASDLKPAHIGLIVFLPETEEDYPLFGRLDAVVIKPGKIELRVGGMEREVGAEQDIDLITPGDYS